MSSDRHLRFQGSLLASGVCALLAGIAAWCAAQDAPPAGAAASASVVTVENPQATEAFAPRPQIVQEMVRRGILRFSGKTNVADAWRSLVATNDVVGLKVYSEPGPNSGTRPALVEAVVQGLLEAGLPSTNIIIWDKRLADLRLSFSTLADHYNVRLAGSADSGYDEKVFYDNPVAGNLIAGDLEFDRDGAKSGRKSYVTKLLTGRVTKFISITPLLNHNVAGVCGHLYSVAMGSVDNTARFENSSNQLARAVPEIYALRAVGDRVVLCVTDALIGQYQGEQLSLLHYSTELSQIWFSKAPVACDVLAGQELDNERQARNIISLGGNPALFQNAALLELGVADPARIHIDAVR